MRINASNKRNQFEYGMRNHLKRSSQKYSRCAGQCDIAGMCETRQHDSAAFKVINSYTVL